MASSAPFPFPASSAEQQPGLPSSAAIPLVTSPAGASSPEIELSSRRSGVTASDGNSFRHTSIGSEDVRGLVAPILTTGESTPTVRDVCVLDMEKEWCDGWSDSSSEEEAARRWRPPPPPSARARYLQQQASSRPSGRESTSGQVREEVAVVEANKEWSGALGLSSSDESEAIPSPRTNRHRGQGANRHSRSSFGSRASRASGRRESKLQTGIRSSRRPSVQIAPHSSVRDRSAWDRPGAARCTLYTIMLILHCADFCLRVFVVSFYIRHFDRTRAVTILLGLQVLGIAMAAIICFHDADVLLILMEAKRRSKVLMSLLSALVCVFCACCQMIQVKRGYARQFKSAKIMTEIASMDDDPQTLSAAARSFPFVGLPHERVFPVTLLTGIPYVLVSCYMLLVGEWIYTPVVSRVERALLVSSTSFAAATVTLGIIEMDVAVSTYVLKRHHMNPQIHGTRAGRWQWLYPVVHFCFRVSEVAVRTLSLLTCFAVSRNLFGPPTAVLLAILDYCLGVIMLHVNSPDRERVVVHMLVAVGLLVSNLTYFVDQPNFAFPARTIHKHLNLCRTLTLAVVLSVIWAIEWSTGANLVSMDIQKTFIICIAVYYALLFSPIIRRLGHDLHTAAQEGNCTRIEKLLEHDGQGNMLDVNGLSKDALEMTPAMLAAIGGHKMVLEILINAKADVNMQNAAGNTCLHLAAQSGQVDTCRYLLHKGADGRTRNVKGQAPVDIAEKRRSLRNQQNRNQRSQSEGDALVETLRISTEEPLRLGQIADGLASANVGYGFYAVGVQTCGGYQLKSLFPQARDDDTPSPRALHSVSAFVISRATGMLARHVLARQDLRGESIQLGTLRRVGDLGRGGFGRVVEVEAPSLVHSRRSLKKFALKLQLKSQSEQQAFAEVAALRRCEHPFIVKLEKAFQTPQCFALLLELCPTDLNRVLCETTNQDGKSMGLEPIQAATYMGQVALALTHLHSQGIVFRDVKPDNILISKADEAKLTDFGLAKVVRSSERHNMSMCGTVGFFPPELTAPISGVDQETILEWSNRSDNYFKMDAYSFGVTLQVTLLGEDGAQKRDVRRKGVMMLPLSYTEEDNTNLLQQLLGAGRLQPEAHSLLVERLLPHDPSRRSRLVEVIDDPFFLNTLDCKCLSQRLMNGRDTV